MSIGRRLSTEEKKEIFSHLVSTQDSVHNVRKSYEVVTEHFSISEEQLKAIEQEGLDNEWPPLSEPRMRFAFASARVDVMPAGLSSSRTPSGPPERSPAPECLCRGTTSASTGPGCAARAAASPPRR